MKIRSPVLAPVMQEVKYKATFVHLNNSIIDEKQFNSIYVSQECGCRLYGNEK